MLKKRQNELKQNFFLFEVKKNRSDIIAGWEDEGGY